ncbi:MAG: hypothetical protein ACFCUS_01770 [Rubrimonas sp.]|uniref:protein-tyrosine phosphatase family protein n=1 Tax=Rubrimonas sp. TaxID=2036015 RepID=UPI002FDEFAA1
MRARHDPPDAAEAALGFRTTIALPDGGAALMLAYPGLDIAVDGRAWIDPDAMREVVARLAARRVAILISLACRRELPHGAGALLSRLCSAQAIRLARLPIADYAAPGRRWLAAMARFGGRLDALTASGRPVALCCQYGAGRSGAVAAFLLMRQGCPAPSAISRVRAGFAEAIESDAQREWLEAVRAPQPGAGSPMVALRH